MSSTMKLTTKLHQTAVLERIAETDWQTGNSAPFVVELDPTAACDLACPGCISEDLIAQGGRFSDERLMALGQEFIDAGVKAVILIGGGEPLAHRAITPFMTLLGENDVHIGITTNGSFIDRHIGAIAKYAQWTRVSMDAATEATFSKLRPTKGRNAPNKFNKIISNMRLLAEVKKGKLGYSFLVQTPADGPHVESNIGEIYDAAVLARNIGCDYFEVKPTYQFREGIDHALMRHDPKLMEQAAAEIARLDALETDTFKILRAINLQASLDGVEVPQVKDYKVCPSTHLRTTVTPSGVFVCPYWRGKDHMRIGDVNNTSFQDMWHGAQRANTMAQLSAARDCGFHCLRHDTNREALALKYQMREGIRVSGLAEFDRFI